MLQTTFVVSIGKPHISSRQSLGQREETSAFGTASGHRSSDSVEQRSNMAASLNESGVGENRSVAVSLHPAINTKDAFSCDKHCESSIGRRFFPMLLEKTLDSHVTNPSNRVKLYERTDQLEDVYQKRWAAIEFHHRDSGCYSSTTEEIHLVSPNPFQSTGLPQQGGEDAESLRNVHYEAVHRCNGCQIRESEDASLANVSEGEVFNKDSDKEIQRSQGLQSKNASFQVLGSEGLGKAEVASRFQSVGKNRLVGLQSNFSDETSDTRTKIPMGTMSVDKQGGEQHVQIVKRHNQRDANICRTQDPTVTHLLTVGGDVKDERLLASKAYGEQQFPFNNGHARLRSHTTHKKREESDWKCPGSVPHHLASNSRDASTLTRNSRQSLVDEQGDHRDLTMKLWALRKNNSDLHVPVFLPNSHVHPQPFEKKPEMMAFDNWANKTLSVTELAALRVGARFTVNRSCSENTERLLKGLTKYLLNPKGDSKTNPPVPSKAEKEINIQRTSSSSDIADSIKSSTLQSLDSNETNDNKVITDRSYQQALNSRPISVDEDSRLLGKENPVVILPLIYLRRKGRDLNKSDEQRPPIADKSDEQRPPIADKSDEQRPPIADKSDEQRPPIADKSDEQNPPIADKSDEKRPLIADKSDEQRPSIADKSDEQRPPIADKSDEQRPPIADKSDEQRPPIADKSDEQRPPIADKSDEQRPPIADKSDEQRPPIADKSDEQRPPIANKSDEQRPPIANKSDEQRPPIADKSDEQRPSIADKSDEQRPPIADKSDEQRPPIADPEVVSTESSAQHASNPKLPQSGNIRRIILDKRALSCLATLQQMQKEKGCDKQIIVALKTTRSNIPNCTTLDKRRECYIKTVKSIIKLLIEKHKLKCEGFEQGLPTDAKEKEDGPSLLSNLKLLIAKVYDTKSVSQTPSGGDLSSSSASARCNNVRSDETWDGKVNRPSVKLLSEKENAATTHAADDGKTGEEAKWPWQKGSDEEGKMSKSSTECFSADAGKQISQLANMIKNELACFKDDVRKANKQMEGTSSAILGSIAPHGSSSYPQLLKPLYSPASESQTGIDYCSSLQDESKTKNIKIGKESKEENSGTVCQSSPLSVQTIFNEKEQKESKVLESTLCAKMNLSFTYESRNFGVGPLLTDKEQIHIEGVAQKSDDLDLSTKMDGFRENPEKSASLRSVRTNEQTRKVCEPSEHPLKFTLPIEAVMAQMFIRGFRLILIKGRSRENTEKTVPTIGTNKKQISKCKSDAEVGLSAEKKSIHASSAMVTRPAAGQCSRHSPSSDLENRSQAIMQNGWGYAGPGTVATTDSQQTLKIDVSAEAAARNVTLVPTGSLVVTVGQVRGQWSAPLPDTSSGAGGQQEFHSHFHPKAITNRNVVPCTEHWLRAEWRAEMNDDRVRATNGPLSSQDGRVRQQLLSKDPRVVSLQQRALSENSTQNACAPVQQVEKSFNPVQQTQNYVLSVQQASMGGWSRHPPVESRIKQQNQMHRPSHLTPRLPSRHGQPSCYQQPTMAQQHSHEFGSASPKQRIENQEALPKSWPPHANQSTKGSSADKTRTRPFSVVDCNLNEIMDNPLTRSSPFTVNLKMSIWSPRYDLLPQVEDFPLGETTETCRCHQKKLCGPRCIRRYWL